MLETAAGGVGPVSATGVDPRVAPLGRDVAWEREPVAIKVSEAQIVVARAPTSEVELSLSTGNSLELVSTRLGVKDDEVGLLDALVSHASELERPVR